LIWNNLFIRVANSSQGLSKLSINSLTVDNFIASFHSHANQTQIKCTFIVRQCIYHSLYKNGFVQILVVNRHQSLIINGNKLNSVDAGINSLTTYHRHKFLATSAKFQFTILNRLKSSHQTKQQILNHWEESQVRQETEKWNRNTRGEKSKGL